MRAAPAVRFRNRILNCDHYIHYFVATIVIFHTHIPGVPWWLTGGVLGFAMMTPMLIHVGHDDKKQLPIIAANSVVLGTAAGFLAHYLG